MNLRCKREERCVWGASDDISSFWQGNAALFLECVYLLKSLSTVGRLV